MLTGRTWISGRHGRTRGQCTTSVTRLPGSALMTICIESLNSTSICLCTAWYASFSFWAHPEYLPLSEQQYRSGQPFLSCPGHRGQVRGTPGPPESFRLRRRGGRLGQSCAGHDCAFKKGTYMSIKSKLLAGAAALALVGGVGTV